MLLCQMCMLRLVSGVKLQIYELQLEKGDWIKYLAMTWLNCVSVFVALEILGKSFRLALQIHGFCTIV